MKSPNKSGFTIIETMLFLGISGLLVVSILAGTGASISVQRYRDSVNTLLSTIQSQFSDVASVKSDRSSSLRCGASGVVSGGSTEPIGQSDCVILGKYFTINNSNIESSLIVGYYTGVLSPSSDIAELQNYKLSILAGSTEKSTLEWGAKIAYPKTGSGSKNPTTPRLISFLILRSPMSGAIYSFSGNEVIASDNIPSDSSDRLQAMITTTASGVNYARTTRLVCVDSGTGINNGMSISISAFASSASAIEMKTNELLKSQNGTGASQC